jgi:PIN domain nuclease of toxin-antitoxin system
MSLLLDTCALIALAQGSLPSAASKALCTAPRAFVSQITPWEIAIKAKNGKLTLPLPSLEWMEALARRHTLEFPAGGLDAALLCAAADLPLLHRDPFDRVLVATALRMNLSILTSDQSIAAYPGIQTLW